MKVVYCADRNIYPLLPTAINSLLKNNPEIEKIYLVIEDDGINYIHHPKITLINVNNFDFLIRDGFNCTRKFPYMAMVRCFLSKILKEDKIIYLDVDTTVVGSLKELWNLNLGNNFIAAREESSGYFNSGVLLMNLKLIRAMQVDDKLEDILRKCKFVFPDQDAINIIFKNKILRINKKFNRLGKIFKNDNCGEIVIRHYAGITKPWKENADIKDKEFWNKYKIDYIKED